MPSNYNYLNYVLGLGMITHSKGIENIVKKRIAHGSNYHDTLRTTYGADPREVWDVFSKYKKESAEKIGICNFYPKLPEPHSIYSQWRMTPKATKVILQKLLEKDYKKICFLGCPVLGIEFGKVSPSRPLLLDIDSTILNNAKQSAEILVYDVNNKIPKELIGTFECVITDPPWYYQDIKLFIKKASELAKKGGTVYLSCPSLLTKPSILEERLDLQKWLSNLNLVFAELNSIVEYEVPPFEYMAYFDIPAFTGKPWRIGDLLKLKKSDDSSQTVIVDKTCFNWKEYSFGVKRVFLREKEDDTEKPKLSLVRDNSLTLNTVSRRSPLIPKIDIWTSRNAVLHIDSGFNVIKSILDSLAKGAKEIPPEISDRYAKKYKKEVTDSIQKLRAIIGL